MFISGITIVTTENCEWCVLAKKLLKKHKIAFKELNIPQSLSREEFFDLTEKYETKKTVPKIFIGKKLIGGYEDLEKYIEDHEGEFFDG